MNIFFQTLIWEHVLGICDCEFAIWQGLAFVDRSIIPQSFRRARICKFSRQKHCFLQLRENRPFVVVKRLTHTGTFPQTPFLMFRCDCVLWLCTGCQRTYTHTQTSSLKHPFLMHFYFTMKTFSLKHPFRCLDIHFYLSI